MGCDIWNTIDMSETIPLISRPLPAIRCRDLRSKEIIMNLGYHPSGDQSLGPPCWCFRTQQIFGPDGGQVNKWDCAPGRTCYESSGQDQEV